MSSKKQRRREAISALVLEQGAVTVGSLAERFDVSMQTIRRDVDALCEGDMLHRVHGRIELSEEFLNTPFDQRAGTNLMGKRAIGEAAAELIPDGSTVFISIGSTPLSVAQALRRRKGLTVITNNLSAAMALSEEVSNRIILPGGEVALAGPRHSRERRSRFLWSLPCRVCCFRCGRDCRGWRPSGISHNRSARDTKDS